MPNKFREVRCRSGLLGWRGRLQDVYDTFDEFAMYDRVYNQARRLGFKTARGAWRSNPMVEGSVQPSDYRRVK